MNYSETCMKWTLGQLESPNCHNLTFYSGSLYIPVNIYMKKEHPGKGNREVTPVQKQFP